jgi:hypothetical protein
MAKKKDFIDALQQLTLDGEIYDYERRIMENVMSNIQMNLMFAKKHLEADSYQRLLEIIEDVK